MATWTDQRVRPAPRAVVPPPSPRPQPARSQPRTVLGLIALGAIAVVALWWLDTPSVSGFGDWLTNAGRITGLLAGYAVVMLLALMARIPAMAPSAMRPSTVRGWLRAGCGRGDGGGTTARGAGRTRWSVHVAISAPQVPGTAVSPPSLGSPAADDIVGTLLLYKLCSGYPRPWNSREEEHGRGIARGGGGRQAVRNSARGVARASRWSVVTSPW